MPFTPDMRRRVDQIREYLYGGSALILVAAERARDFPQSLPLAVNRGRCTSSAPTRASRPSFPRQRESRAARVLADPWTPASAGVTKETPPRASSASPAPRPLPRPASRTICRPSDDLRRLRRRPHHPRRRRADNRAGLVTTEPAAENSWPSWRQ